MSPRAVFVFFLLLNVSYPDNLNNRFFFILMKVKSHRMLRFFSYYSRLILFGDVFPRSMVPTRKFTSRTIPNYKTYPPEVSSLGKYTKPMFMSENTLFWQMLHNYVRDRRNKFFRSNGGKLISN